MSTAERQFFVPEDDDKFISDALVHLELSSDAQLEALADLAKHTLSKARQGAQQLGPWNRAKILDLRSYSGIRNMILACFGEKGREWVALDRRRIVVRIDGDAWKKGSAICRSSGTEKR
ncbi:hypothetical protein [Burkholderia ubonensis]|uniref:hypothetical protein n=1 Tax=Burkholderia ubonensis TaxID=101571 RepID=UPI0015841C3F|nr:hypothetical protein [Burkholderia ubonensis]